VSCADADLVTAVFQVVNLGSTDHAEQVVAVGKIAQKAAEVYAEIYLEVTEQVVRGTLGRIWADAIDEFTPLMIQTVTAAFEDIIIPFFSEVAEFISTIFGVPNCNGDVLHDIAVFKPSEPKSPVTVSKVYTADSVSGCGSAAKTSVHVTLERVTDVVQIFPNTPAPKVVAVPSAGESADSWLGTWAEDTYTATPIVLVTIARSTAASGAYAITVEEHIDRRYDAQFQAVDAVETVESALAAPYLGNVFGTLKPWLSNVVSPGDLTTIRVGRLVGGGGSGQGGGGGAGGEAGGARGTPHQAALRVSGVGLTDEAVAEPTVTFALSWDRQPNPVIGPPPADRLSRNAPSTRADLFDEADAFVLEGKGVVLYLYNFRLSNQELVGRCLRYCRDETSAFTRADVELVQWKPLR
jgi:hypothetical protein